MRKVELNDLYQFKFVSNPTWSPEADKAVFTVYQACEKENNYFSNLYLLQDGKTTQLTNSGDAKNAIWLDNNTLLFASLRKQADKDAVKKGDNLTVFYTLNLKGGEAQEYMRLNLKGASLKKLDNGTFACVAKHDYSGEDSPLCEVFDELPFWKNGEGYSNKVRSGLYIVKDGQAERITAENESVMSWNVKGSKIIYTSHPYDNYGGTDCGITVYENGEKHVLIEDGVWNIRWTNFLGDTPIAYMTDSQLHGRNQIARVYAIDGAQPRMLFDIDEVVGSAITGDSTFGGGASVVVDGNALYYVAVEDMHSVLRKFDENGLQTLLTATGSLDNMTVKNGKILVNGIGQDRMSELYLVENGSMKQMTTLNEALYTDRKIAMPEPVAVVDADGIEIHGYVLRPTDYEEGKMYPAIMDIHGGPFAAFGTPYFHEMQYWAAQGYFVFYCNPRGGQGRGGDFGDLRGKYGTIDYDDLMLFCDKVLESYPMIDTKRVGVTGGSYGGFMTNWIIGHTDRFAAAASQRCIANWISFYLTTDIGPWFGQDQCQGNPWDDTEKLWWHSPLKYAKNVKTPTLFIHSDQDYRCWMSEVLQMFSSLKLNGVDSRVCLFHGENHELSRGGKPQNRVRRIAEITAWMDKYLK
ncbi:MAG: S9 family peptidase [Firmicutes bacterium]|nr:S9 family peptidase [Bacillota bacterium]